MGTGCLLDLGIPYLVVASEVNHARASTLTCTEMLSGVPLGGPRGPWGGDGFLPPMGAPPGARFDPVGPGLGPFPPGGGGRAPRRMGDPDNDEFMPPGMGDMYM